jgi:hypothetical protein
MRDAISRIPRVILEPSSRYRGFVWAPGSDGSLCLVANRPIPQTDYADSGHIGWVCSQWVIPQVDAEDRLTQIEADYALQTTTPISPPPEAEVQTELMTTLVPRGESDAEAFWWEGDSGIWGEFRFGGVEIDRWVQAPHDPVWFGVSASDVLAVVRAGAVVKEPDDVGAATAQDEWCRSFTPDWDS